MTQNKLGKKGFVSAYNLQCVIQGSWGKEVGIKKTSQKTNILG